MRQGYKFPIVAKGMESSILDSTFLPGIQILDKAI